MLLAIVGTRAANIINMEKPANTTMENINIQRLMVFRDRRDSAKGPDSRFEFDICIRGKILGEIAVAVKGMASKHRDRRSPVNQLPQVAEQRKLSGEASEIKWEVTGRLAPIRYKRLVRTKRECRLAYATCFDRRVLCASAFHFKS